MYVRDVGIKRVLVGVVLCLDLLPRILQVVVPWWLLQLSFRFFPYEGIRCTRN
ncbi:hypothetical protein BDV23DRAFT_144299 [Aspergillus alliaceus]|uniref:Uncharacterized protein n=1 Tax=Petromyces alliaceus TaxID=209559 RepID=A0A5N7CPF9_PETAA|nr:hypothetical protein BDV23DRAFT_144299 [Aspergillus alliaceus]